MDALRPGKSCCVDIGNGRELFELDIYLFDSIFGTGPTVRQNRNDWFARPNDLVYSERILWRRSHPFEMKQNANPWFADFCQIVAISHQFHSAHCTSF
jgi:hypothetical protein